MAGRTIVNDGNVGGFTTSVQASVTRPANTTQYTSGDVITAGTAAVLTFADVARVDGGTGVILKGQLIDGANQGTKLSSELWLFNVAPASFGDDNAAFTPTDAELLALVGVIPFTTSYVGDATSGADGNCVFKGDETNIGFTCADDDRNLYGVLVARSTYTPVSGEVFTVALLASQD